MQNKVANLAKTVKTIFDDYLNCVAGENMNRKITLQYYKKRIKKALEYIELHLDEDIALGTLAKVTHFSFYHFHRVFTGIVGESVKDYIRRLKLERAARQLQNNNFTVTEIAFSAGYESVAAFTRVFREMFNTNPRSFRLEQREIQLTQILKYSGVRNMQVIIKNVPKLRVAAVRHVGPYMECGPAFEKLFSLVPCDVNSKVLGISHDDPDITEAHKIRFDACLTVTNNFKPVDGLEIKDVFGGKYAMTMHKGPYANLHKTYTVLVGKWIPENGYELRSEPPIEIYMNDPNSAKPEDLLTEVYVPIK